ncbi:TIGR01906 family membrane protein [Helicovermis profundi]|uniref:TIGR01906 family membrane protein n=1 Tax=Helicovermis profundi TaxID=3065157 RepID=A0AAU9ET40_9FIRM|nr:TIGR01906 family membrane protein [Clostridia bacterium S502]
MSKTIKTIGMIIIGILLSISILVFSVDHYTFSSNYYVNKFVEFSVKDLSGLTDDGIVKAADKLTKYLKYKNESLDLKLNISGKIREVFNEKEKSHMVDVKNIFRNLNKFKDVSIGIIFLYLVLGLKYDFLRKKDIKNIFIVSFIFMLTIFIGLFILVNIDFTKYFIKFHQMFFSNKLWILDPSKDVLIQLLPEQFFIDITVKILELYGIITTTLTALVYLIYRHKFTS